MSWMSYEEQLNTLRSDADTKKIRIITNPFELKGLLKRVAVKTRQRVLIWGVPGVGKTQIIRSLVEELNREGGNFRTIVVQVTSDLQVGLPRVTNVATDEGKVKPVLVIQPAHWLDEIEECLSEGITPVLFLDEISNASIEAQGMLNAYLYPQLGGVGLTDKSTYNVFRRIERVMQRAIVVSAANPRSTSEASRGVIETLRNRVTQVVYHPDPQLFIKNFVDYWNEPPEHQYKRMSPVLVVQQLESIFSTPKQVGEMVVDQGSLQAAVVSLYRAARKLISMYLIQPGNDMFVIQVAQWVDEVKVPSPRVWDEAAQCLAGIWIELAAAMLPQAMRVPAVSSWARDAVATHWRELGPASDMVRDRYVRNIFTGSVDLSDIIGLVHIGGDLYERELEHCLAIMHDDIAKAFVAWHVDLGIVDVNALAESKDADYVAVARALAEIDRQYAEKIPNVMRTTTKGDVPLYALRIAQDLSKWAADREKQALIEWVIDLVLRRAEEFLATHNASKWYAFKSTTDAFEDLARRRKSAVLATLASIVHQQATHEFDELLNPMKIASEETAVAYYDNVVAKAQGLSRVWRILMYYTAALRDDKELDIGALVALVTSMDHVLGATWSAAVKAFLPDSDIARALDRADSIMQTHIGISYIFDPLTILCVVANYLISVPRDEKTMRAIEPWIKALNALQGGSKNGGRSG